MENNNYIVLSTDKELKVLMSPIRQKIIKVMRREGKTVNAKQLADKLNISSSSIQHHIKLLQQVGIVEFDHNEIINGITAKYFRLSEKTIRIGQDINDDLSSERDVLARNILSKTYNGYKELILKKRLLLSEEYRKGNKIADQMTGVVHLTIEEANELFDIIENFMKNHLKSSEDTHPFEFALIAYQADLINEASED